MVLIALFNKIVLCFVNSLFGVLFSWGVAFVAGGIESNPDWQTVLITFLIGILVGVTLSFLERYLAGLNLIAQLGTFASPSIIGAVAVIEDAAANRITIGHVFFTVWLCVLVCAMYYGDLSARRLS
jgi:hypothetical protein